MNLTYSPPNYASVNSPLMWILYDANSIDATKINYKYVAEVWIAGVKVYTERSYPRPLGSYGVFDFSTVIRNYVAATFNPASGILAQQSGENDFRTADVVINVREEYNGTVGAIVFTDTAHYFFNHYNERQEILTAIAPFKDLPLTNRSKTNIEIHTGATQYFIPFFATGTAAVNLTINGVVTTFTPTIPNTCLLINIFIPGVDSYDVYFGDSQGDVPALFTEDGQIIIGEDGQTITAETAAAGAISNHYKVNVVFNGLYQNYLIHFLNKYGAFETMLFNKVSKKRKQIERKDYKQQPYRIDAAGLVSYGSTYVRNEQRVVFSSRSEEKLRMQTNFVSDADYLWLSELINSPQVYLEDTGICYPVVITDTNYEYKQHIVDSLTTLSIEVDFASSTNTQFR